jgi:predicted Holliday junction resolvase-like endonuclease
MANTVLIILGLICLIIWNVVGFYAAYTTIRDDRRKEFERKMEEREELERKITRQIRDEVWLEEQSRKLRQEELKKKFEESQK